MDRLEDVEKAIRTFLIGEGFGNVCLGGMSEDVDDAAIFVQIRGGGSTGTFSGVMHDPNVQIIVRTAPHQQAEGVQRTDDIYHALTHSEPGGDVAVYSTAPRTPLGPDDDDRYRFTINFPVQTLVFV